MLVATHPGGHAAVTQQAHAWVSGQLARAWGAEGFGPVAPWEEVCLAAEQHDVGMAAWDRDPTLNPRSGLPTTFMEMELATHLHLWTVGPDLLLGQSRYAALLASRHGSALYARRDLGSMEAGARAQVEDFLGRRREFEAGVRATLPAVSDQEVERNQRLVWTWDGLSLALILGWAPWTGERVPTAGGGAVDLELTARGGRGHVLEPWPFVSERLTVRTQGRLLRATYADQAQLRRALAAAPWVDLSYELAPA